MFEKPVKSRQGLPSQNSHRLGTQPHNAFNRYYACLDPTSTAYASRLDPRSSDYEPSMDIFNPQSAIYNSELGGTSNGKLTKALESQLKLYAGLNKQQLQDILELGKPFETKQDFCQRREEERQEKRQRKGDTQEKFETENRKLNEEIAKVQSDLVRLKHSPSSDPPSQELHQQKRAKRNQNSQLVDTFRRSLDFMAMNDLPVLEDFMPVSNTTAPNQFNQVNDFVAANTPTPNCRTTPEDMTLASGFAAIDDKVGFSKSFQLTNLYPKDSLTIPHPPEKLNHLKQNSEPSATVQWKDVVFNAKSGGLGGISEGTAGGASGGVLGPMMRQIAAGEMTTTMLDTRASPSKLDREYTSPVECVQSRLSFDAAFRLPASFTKSVQDLLPCIQSAPAEKATRLQKSEEQIKCKNAATVSKSPIFRNLSRSLFSPLRETLWSKRKSLSDRSMLRIQKGFSASSMLSLLELRNFKLGTFWSEPQGVEYTDPRYGWVQIKNPVGR
ncbi:MAG: hypothetical protein MMC33_006241 [Icmadophila ericetorum]|nr:hypothetical protein [Icmadophila ericetorum]